MVRRIRIPDLRKRKGRSEGFHRELLPKVRHPRKRRMECGKTRIFRRTRPERNLRQPFGRTTSWEERILITRAYELLTATAPTKPFRRLAWGIEIAHNRKRTRLPYHRIADFRHPERDGTLFERRYREDLRAPLFGTEGQMIGRVPNLRRRRILNDLRQDRRFPSMTVHVERLGSGEGTG